jgi:hypothetical protein
VATDILSWLKAYDLAGTWADVAGLIGFAITILATFSARRAAVAAKKASEDTRSTIRLFDTAVDTQAIIAALDEIKRLHRGQVDWNALPDKYGAARKQLITLREGGMIVSDTELAVVQSLISNLSDMERQAESHLKGRAAPRGEKFNMLISDDNDALISILQALKTRGGA